MVLQLREATRIIESAIAKAQELNVEISVAICNRDGHLIAFNRMDGVSLAEANREAIGRQLSRRPGDCQASRLRVSHIIFHKTLSVLKVHRRSVDGAGCDLRHGRVEGACGVSGAGYGEVEEECARAGIAAL